MSRALVAAGLCVWLGASLLLSRWRHLTRPRLAERLRPYSAGVDRGRSASVVSASSVADAVGPIASRIGDRVAVLFGVTEPAARRLARLHADIDVVGFRLRQLTWSALALLGALALAAAGLPPVLSLLAAVGAPLLAFLVVEQRLAGASARWQDRVCWELPVVAEHLAMLLNAGYSLGAALARVARRGQGCCASDLAEVTNRIHQGLTERQALEEWSARAGVDALERLVRVLALAPATTDLGRLVSAEARQQRRDLHRRAVVVMERREQQVWVPVTVATLIPGVIFLAVPFLDALRLFAGAP